MPSMIDLLDVNSQQDKQVEKGASSMLELIGTESTPSVPIKPITIPKSQSDATRRYFEEGQNPFMSQLIPGHLGSMNMPEPPGGWDTEGQPLDENKVPYVSKVKVFTKPSRETGLSFRKDDNKPNFIERGIKAVSNLFGMDNVMKLSPAAKAQAVVMQMAKDEGVPLDQYRQSPEFIEKLSSSFINMSSFGLVPAFRKALTGEVDYPTSSTTGYMGEALGSLGGLYAGPIKVANIFMSPILKRLPQAYGNEAIAARLLKSSLHDAFLLGPAMGMAGAGQALEQVTFSQAANKVWSDMKSGASIGALFGLSRGLFPEEGLQTGARILTGLVGLNAYRAHEIGGNPFTNRPLGDVLFDIALDSAFLYKGLPKDVRFEVAEDLSALNDRIDKVRKTEEEINTIPDEVIKQAQQKVNDVEKAQVELEAKKVAEKAKAALEAKVELEVKGEEVKEAKGEEVVEETVEPEKVEEVEELKPTSMTEIIEAEVKPKKVRTKKVKEPVTELDEQLGSPRPEKLKEDIHPFRDTDVEHTNEMSLVYKDKIKPGASPEVFTRYLINEVNRYLNGEEVPIEKVRFGLSELAARSENLWRSFDHPEDFSNWKGTVSEAAKWARLSERKVDKGTTLNMGVDPTQIPEATRRIIDGAKRLASYTAKARGMKEFKPIQAANMLKEEFTRSFIDRSGNIRRELLDQLGDQGYEILQRMYLSKGASSLAAQNLKQMRNEVYDGLSKDERRILDNLILADRMIDIGKYKTVKEFKFPEGLTPIESAAYNELFQYTEGITPERAEVLKQRSKAYFEWMKKPLQDMLDAELISQEEYDALASHNYRRLKLVDVFDKRYTSKVGKTKRTVYDSGIESLSRGRDTDIFEPSSEVMALEVFNRAYGRILNNKANQILLDLARTDKENPFVAVKESPSDRIPSGWDRVFVYEKGERKAIYLSPEMAKEWITRNPEMSYKMSQFLRYASGSPVLRTFATGINWGFALANLPRDIMHVWFAARTFENGEWKSVYSPHLPVFSLQMGKDQIGSFSDALLRKGRYEDYIKEGGGVEFLVHQGRLLQRGRHLENDVDKVMNFQGYFGETTEIMTRLALRDRVIKNKAKELGISYGEAAKNKKITQEATFVARDYMDFGQGGGIAKTMDNAIPYLNASIQGTRGLFRAFQPGSGTALISTYKLAQFAALVTGVYIAANKQAPETIKALKGNIDMQNNLCLPLGDGFSFIDDKGQTRYPYIKIPLDPGQRFFKTFFEASTDKWLGNEVDVDAVTNSLSQVSPVGVSSLPPTLSSVLGYTYNKDFWQNEDIWKKTDKPFDWPESKEEYIPGQTPEAFIDFGALTGMSPERTKQAVEQLVTGGSEWSYLAGGAYDLAFSDMPKDNKEKHLAQTLSKVPIIKRFFGITNPYSQYGTKTEEAKMQSDVDRWVQNRGLDTLVEGYLYKDNVNRSEISDYIYSFKDKDIRDRLKDRLKFSEDIKDLPNRSFWLSLKGITDTKARARLYVDRLDSSNDQERDQLMREYNIVNKAGGIVSDEFRSEVRKLRIGE